ncbi:MAG: hypothetical protein NTY02_05240, partial [Acidobacteria bacterium]|nr:hypothetical protein [Acidobacteriota bacterium]
RFVSPAFRADQRALTVEAVVANRDDALKPGMFVSADITVPGAAPSLVVPTAAVATAAGISHVFVVTGNKAEQRMVMPGAVLGPITEILNGLTAGELVATTQVAALFDGAPVRVAGQAAGPAAIAPSPSAPTR